MRRAIIGIASLSFVACAAATTTTAFHSTPVGAPVSKQKGYELKSAVLEMKYDNTGELWLPTKTSGYDECITELRCDYCRVDSGRWVLQGCAK